MKPTLLVTGSNGFVGKHFLSNLNLRDYNTFRLNRGSKSNETDKLTLEELPNVKIDVVIHLAGMAHVMDLDETNSIDAFRLSNVEFTMEVARQTFAAGATRFIFLSSIGVNGGSNLNPFTEHDEPSPTDNYSISKLEAETQLKAFAEEVGMELVIIRPPLVYGNNAPGNFGRLAKMVKKSLPLPLGAVNNLRSLISVDNLIDFIVLCISHPDAANQIFLVSDDHDVSTTHLLTLMNKAIGKMPLLIPIPVSWLRFFSCLIKKEKLIDKMCSSLVVDISHAKNKLGWKPPITIEEGLRRCFND